MATFAYIARDAGGQQVQGRLAGASEQHVLTELHARHLAPVTVTPVAERPALRRRVSIRHLSSAYGQLSDLLSAGVPLLRGLRLLGRNRSSPRLAAAMSSVAEAVADGERLAEAMATHATVFPEVHVAMIRAGERGGFLEQVLSRMARFLEHQADLRGKVVGNLIYPLVLITLSLVIVVLALVFFVPKFEVFYARIEVPVPTMIVLGASRLLTSFWLPTLVGLLVLAFGVRWVVRQPRVRRALAIIQFRIPMVGALVRDLAVARFARLLGTLLENGVPMLSAMQIARDAAGHVLLVEAVDQARDAVRSGETLARPLAESGLFSDDVVEIISVGESANNLPVVLTAIADTIEKRIDRMLAVLVRLMEPALLLVMGGVVMFIFIALVVPMLRMSAALSG